MTKYVYTFDEAKVDDNAAFVLGNKGAQLAQMVKF